MLCKEVICTLLYKCATTLHELAHSHTVCQVLIIPTELYKPSSYQGLIHWVCFVLYQQTNHSTSAWRPPPAVCSSSAIPGRFGHWAIPDVPQSPPSCGLGDPGCFQSMQHKDPMTSCSQLLLSKGGSKGSGKASAIHKNSNLPSIFQL